MTTSLIARPRRTAGPLCGRELLFRTKEFAEEKRLLSWWHLASTMTSLVGLLAITTLNLPWFARSFASVLSALVLVRMFIIYHDHQHGAILRRSRLARWIMLAYGILTLNPPSAWKSSHNHHHKNNAKFFARAVGTFPVMTTEAFAKASRVEQFKYALSRHPLTMLFGYFTVFIYSMCLKSLWEDPWEHFDCAIAVGLQIALIVGLAMFSLDLVLFTHGIPLMVAAGLGAYLFYSQHNFPGVKLQQKGEWDYIFAALHSSSYTKMNPVMRWFTGNIGYHHVHHLNAHIPFYRLPETMSRISELQVATAISLGPRDIYRCLRLKLWDTEKNRMVTFSGLP